MSRATVIMVTSQGLHRSSSSRRIKKLLTFLHVVPNEEIYAKSIYHAIPSLEFANQTSCLCSTVGLHSISLRVVWGLLAYKKPSAAMK
jgi:hypothetical protein